MDRLQCLQAMGVTVWRDKTAPAPEKSVSAATQKGFILLGANQQPFGKLLVPVLESSAEALELARKIAESVAAQVEFFAVGSEMLSIESDAVLVLLGVPAASMKVSDGVQVIVGESPIVLLKDANAKKAIWQELKPLALKYKA